MLKSDFSRRIKYAGLFSMSCCTKIDVDSAFVIRIICTLIQAFAAICARSIYDRCRYAIRILLKGNMLAKGTFAATDTHSRICNFCNIVHKRNLLFFAVLFGGGSLGSLIRGRQGWFLLFSLYHRVWLLVNQQMVAGEHKQLTNIFLKESKKAPFHEEKSSQIRGFKRMQ